MTRPPSRDAAAVTRRMTAGPPLQTSPATALHGCPVRNGTLSREQASNRCLVQTGAFVSPIALVATGKAVATWRLGLADRPCCHQRIALLATWDIFSRNMLLPAARPSGINLQ
jgi:hypothetical protein